MAQIVHSDLLQKMHKTLMFAEVCQCFIEARNRKLPLTLAQAEPCTDVGPLQIDFLFPVLVKQTLAYGRAANSIIPLC